jgi:hypothetical protein
MDSKRGRLLQALRDAGSEGITYPELFEIGGVGCHAHLESLRMEGHSIPHKAERNHRGELVLRYWLQDDAWEGR